MDELAPPNNNPPKGETNVGDVPENDTQLLARVRQNYEDGVGAFEENRRMHSEDLNFVYNSEAMGQWDPTVLEARKGKPCYTFNRCIGPVNLVIADMRQTRPSIKVRPTNEAANEATAEVFGGLIRAAEIDSRAVSIYKTQYKFAVAGGYGAWYLTPEYEGDDTFDQVVRLKDIPNPQTVIWDFGCNDPCAGDAMWGIIGDRILKTKFRQLYPDRDTEGQSFNVSRDSYGWFTDKEIRVVNYYERVPFEYEIAEMSDGTVITYGEAERALEQSYKELEEAGQTIHGPRVERTRKVLKWRVMWLKCSGSEVLEGPIYYNWKRVPIVRVPGRYINIEGRKKLQGLIRHAKDAQRSYNSRASDMIERSALVPKAPYLVTEAMVKGYETEWAQANVASRPYLPYNVDPKSASTGGIPTRTQPIDMPQGAIALAQQAISDLQATIGFFDPAMGNAEDMNRVSGKALVQHTRRSDLSSFEFIDGFGDAMQLTGEMFIDMIPTVMDTQRVVRIVGQDGVGKMLTVNQQMGDDGDVMHDLSKGRYGVTVTIGPSYQTARQEALQTMIEAAEVVPGLAQMTADLLAKNIDSPDADEMSRRMRIPLIHQGIIKPTEAEKGNIPPPPAPDPEKTAEVERLKALTERDKAQAVIANHKAQNLPRDDHEKVLKMAGEHLANILTAHRIGADTRAAETAAKTEADEAGQRAAEGQQSLRQSGAEHALDMTAQAHTHAADMARTIEQHRHEMARTHERHQQEIKHTAEKHTQALAHAKELAAAKAKAASSPSKK